MVASKKWFEWGNKNPLGISKNIIIKN